MQFAPRHAPTAPPAATAAAELLHALEGWKALCEAGARALSSGNVEALHRALEAREAFRAHIEDTVGRLRSEQALPTRTVREITLLADRTAAADAELLQRMEEERGRIGRELDTLRRGNDSAAAYLRPESPSPHRLDIVR